MTPKEMAQELVESFIPYADRHLYFKKLATYVPSEEHQLDSAKQCALIAVDALLEHEKNFHSVLDKATDYLQEVKQEIEKL